MRDKLIALLKQLSLHQDVHQITAEALAQAAHIPLQTVLQTLGSVQNYPALIAFEQPNITRERILSAAKGLAKNFFRRSSCRRRNDQRCNLLAFS